MWQRGKNKLFYQCPSRHLYQPTNSLQLTLFLFFETETNEIQCSKFCDVIMIDVICPNMDRRNSRPWENSSCNRNCRHSVQITVTKSEITNFTNFILIPLALARNHYSFFFSETMKSSSIMNSQLQSRVTRGFCSKDICKQENFRKMLKKKH